MDAGPMMTNACFLAAGLLAGAIHFALLRRTTTLYLQPGRFAMAAGLQIGRLAALGGVLAVIAPHGPLPLLLAALGVLAARPIVMRMMPATP